MRIFAEPLDRDESVRTAKALGSKMGLAIPAYLGNCSFTGADNRPLTFIPVGAVETRGDRSLLDLRSPGLVKREGILAVRIFVALAGRTSQEVVALVEQGLRAPAPPFVVQKGCFRSERDGRMVKEDGVQAVFLDIEGHGLDRFRTEMQELGERIGKLLSGEWLYFELQSDGFARGFMTLSAW